MRFQIPSTLPIMHNKQPGFALVVTLSLIILLTVIAVGLLALSSITLRQSKQSDAMAKARANARLALMVAIGELQKSAGQDQRITAAADILPTTKPTTTGRAQWIGVWDTRSYSPATPDAKTFVRWLVSDSPAAPADATAAPGSDDVLLFTGKDAASSVKVPKINISDSTVNGSYAYWISDEGLKADLGWHEGNFTSSEASQAARLASAPGPDYGSLAGPFTGKTNYPVAKTAGNSWLQNLDKAVSVADAPLAVDATNQGVWLRNMGHDITLGSSGVMADVKKGGLRRDLSLAFEMDGTADVTATSQPVKFNRQEGEFVGGNDRLAAPKAAHGMGGVRERFLYRDFRNSGSTFSGSIAMNTSVLRGPNWWALRDYANLYKRLKGTGGNYTLDARSYYPNVSAKDVNYTLGKATGVASGNSWDSETNNGSHGDTYIFRPARSNYAPVILGSVCLYSAISKDSKLGLGIDPFFYLWNPYNRTLKTDHLAIVAEHGFPGHITFYVTPNGGSRKQYGPSSPKDYLAAHATGKTQNRPLTYLISNLTMAPGEILVVSPSSSRSVTADAFNDEARPGTNTDNESGVILTKIPTVDPGKPAEITWDEVHLNPDDQVEFTYSSEYEPKNQAGQVQFNTNWFWLRTYLPAPGTKATDLVNNLKLGDEVQAIDSNSMGDTSVPEYYYPGKNVSVPPVGPYPASTLTNTKNFFGILTYLAKPANYGGKNPNPVEVFSRFNPAPIGNTLNDMWRPCGFNQIFSMVNRAGGANTLLQECAINFPATSLRNGFWGASYASGSTSVPMTNIPSAPIFSLASFSHAALSTRATEPYHAVGNSWSNLFVSPVSPYDTVRNYPWGTPTAADSSWLMNDALFDRYYLSGIAPDFTITASGYSATGSIPQTLARFFSADHRSANANPVLRPYLPPGQNPSTAGAALAADDGYRKTGAYSLIDGAFNVNSTSVTAWTALLRANRNLAISFTQSGSANTSAGSPFPSGTAPTAPGNGAAAFWAGFSRLSDAQVSSLAREIVKQVKLRGPFMSLSDFVNHRIGTPKTAQNYMGALQAAIEAANINSAVEAGAGGVSPAYGSPMSNYLPDPGSTGNRRTSTGIAMDITQAGLLLPLAPRLAARSDTFRIRGYGEARSKDGTQILAKATCEAVVQRFPEYMDPDKDAANNEPWDEASTTGPTLNPTNLQFGRRFKVIRFRWLHADEI
jgi:hypothetical protein